MDMRNPGTLTLDVGADGIAMITIDVPERAMDVLTPQLQAGLAAARRDLLESALGIDLEVRAA